MSAIRFSQRTEGVRLLIEGRMVCDGGRTQFTCGRSVLVGDPPEAAASAREAILREFIREGLISAEALDKS